MNLKEFRDKIDRICDSHPYPEEVTVGIPVFRLNAIGPRGSVNVKSVYLGIDWDSNTLFLHPEGDELREINRDEIKAVCETYNVIASEIMAKRRKK